MVLRRDLQHGGNGLRVPIDQRTNHVRHILGYEHHRHVLSGREGSKRFLNVPQIGFFVHDQEVRSLLEINVADAGEEESGDGILHTYQKKERTNEGRKET